MTRNRSGWLSGASVGAAGGFAALEIPMVGWAVILAFAVAAIVVGPRLAAIGGLFAGIGTTWACLFARMALTCRAIGNDLGCHAADLTPWLAATATLVGIGVALTAIAVSRARRRRSGRGAR